MAVAARRAQSYSAARRASRRLHHGSNGAVLAGPKARGRADTAGGSPLTDRNVLQFPGRFTEEMMVIGRVGVEIRAPRLDGVSRSSPASVNWCSVLYTVARDTEIGAPRVWSDSPLRREPLVHAYKVVKPSLATRHWRDCAASVARSERHQCAFFSSAPRSPENESLSVEPLARCTAAVPFSIQRAPSAAQPTRKLGARGASTCGSRVRP